MVQGLIWQLVNSSDESYAQRCHGIPDMGMHGVVIPAREESVHRGDLWERGAMMERDAWNAVECIAQMG